MICRPAEVVPVEAVVRGYLAGSGWKEYQRARHRLRHPAAGRAARERPPARTDLHARRPRPRPASTTRTSASTVWSEHLSRHRTPSGRDAGALAEAIRDDRSRSTRYAAAVAERAGHPPGGHQVRVRHRLGRTGTTRIEDPMSRAPDPHRRGADSRLLALLGRGRLRTRSRRRRASTSSSCATGSRPSPGTRRRPGRSCRPTSSRARGHATSKPSSGSPAPASSATSRRTSSPHDQLPVRRERDAQARDPRPAGPRGRGQPRSPRASRGSAASGSGGGWSSRSTRTTRPPPGRSSTGWPASCSRTRSSRPTRSSRSARPHRSSARRGTPPDGRPHRRGRLPGQQLRPRHARGARPGRRRARRPVARAGDASRASRPSSCRAASRTATTCGPGSSPGSAR